MGNFPFVLASEDWKELSWFRGAMSGSCGWEEPTGERSGVSAHWSPIHVSSVRQNTGTYHMLYEGCSLLVEMQQGATETQGELCRQASGVLPTMIPGKEIRLANADKLGNILDWHFSFLFYYEGM